MSPLRVTLWAVLLGMLSACATRVPEPPARLRPPGPPVRLDTDDPRYAAYFAVVKRRIEDKWAYPSEALRARQSGQGEVHFAVRRDGSVRTVEIVRSSGVAILDRYIENAIRLASPFPRMPASVPDDVLLISMTYKYILPGPSEAPPRPAVTASRPPGGEPAREGAAPSEYEQGRLTA